MPCFDTQQVAVQGTDRGRAKRRPRGGPLYVWLAVLLLGCVTGPVHAQELPTGARVRVASPGLGHNAGLLLATTRDSLLIGFSHLALSPIAIGREAITSFELSAGGDGGRGATVGAQIGFASGVIAFSIQHLASRRPPPRFQYDHGDLAAAALTGAAVGTAAGALIGAITGQERWDSTALPLASIAALPPLEERAAMQTRIRLGLFAADAAIRVRTHDGQQFAGRYDGLDGAFVRIAADSAYRVPIASIAGIDERRAMTGPWLRRGMLVGAALGLVTVGVAALADDGSCAASEACVQPWGSVTFMFGLGGAFTGATVGAIAGSYVKGWRTQQW